MISPTRLLHTYFKTLIDTISSPKSYIAYLNKSWKWSALFVSVTWLALGLIVSLGIITRDFPLIATHVAASLQDVATYYPPELRIIWDDRELSTTSEAPVVVPLPSEWRQATSFLSLPPTFLIIDPTITLNNQQLSHDPVAQTQFILNKTQLLSSRPGGTWQGMSLNEVPGFEDPFEIYQGNIQMFVNEWTKSLYKSWFALSTVIPFVFPVLFLISRFWLTLLDSAMIYFFSRIFGKPFSFMKIWQLSWHIAIPADLAQQLASWFMPELQLNIYNLTFWILFALLMYELRNVKAVKLILKGK